MRVGAWPACQAGSTMSPWYVTRALPLGVAVLFRGRPIGLGRTRAIIAGLTVASIGFAAAKITASARTPQPQAV